MCIMFMCFVHEKGSESNYSLAASGFLCCKTSQTLSNVHMLGDSLRMRVLGLDFERQKTQNARINYDGAQPSGWAGRPVWAPQQWEQAWLCWACPQPHDSRWQQLCSRQLLWGEGPWGQRAGPSISGKVLRSCPTSLLILHWPEHGPVTTGKCSLHSGWPASTTEHGKWGPGDRAVAPTRGVHDVVQIRILGPFLARTSSRI